jgi:hypothetical protein
VALDVEAVRYVVSVGGRHLAGEETAPRQIALTWILELTGPAEAPWLLASSNNPAEEIPGWT